MRLRLIGESQTGIEFLAFEVLFSYCQDSGLAGLVSC